jgi:alanyl aminopeptidase
MSMRRTLLASALLAAIGVAQAAVPVSTDVPTGPLPRNVVPSLVQLQLKVDPQQARFSGSTRIDVAIAEPTNVIWMHGRNLRIGKAELVMGDKRIALTTEEVDVSGVLKL